MSEFSSSAPKPHVITISTLTIVKVAFFLLGLGFVYLIRDIIALFVVSLVLASIINPLASWFERNRMSRALGVLALYAVIIGLIVFVATSLIPAVTLETRDLLKNADTLWANLLATAGPLRDFVSAHGLGDFLERSLGGASDGAAVAATGVFATIRGFFSGMVSLIIVLVVTFYLVVSEDALRRLFREVAPEAYQPYLVDLFTRIEKSIGAWVRGQLLLSVIVGTAVYVALKILGVKYALVLALAAGVAESIPYLGPLVSSIPAVLIATSQSPVKGLLTGVIYVFIQQTENHILVPKVMQRVTGLHPIVSIFSLLIGVKVAGLIGALLAIPVAMMLGIVAGDVFRMVKANR